MNVKQIRWLLYLIVFCYFFCSIVFIQLETILIDLNEQVTDLKEQEQIIKSENDSILSSIRVLLSMNNLNRIAKEKNFTTNKGRIVVLKLENDQTKEQ